MGRSQLDVLTVAGLFLGVAAVVVSFLMDHGAIIALINPPAMLLVLGGTIGATSIGFRMADLKKLGHALRRALMPPPVDPEKTIARIVELAELARREGLLRLDRELDQIEDDFLRHGVMLVVDGTEEALVRQILGNQVEVRERSALGSARYFETAGGFAPTLGIIGTVLGLVSVLSNLTDVQRLAPSIATAFIATLWGVSTANLFWLPVANKLRYLASRERDLREVIIEGVVAIGNGESPRAVERQLAVFLDPVEKAKARRGGAAAGEEAAGEGAGGAAAGGRGSAP